MMLRPNTCQKLVTALGEFLRPSLQQRPCFRCRRANPCRLRYCVHIRAFTQSGRGAALLFVETQGPVTSPISPLGASIRLRRGLSDLRDNKTTSKESIPTQGLESSLDLASGCSDDLEGSEAEDKTSKPLLDQLQTEREGTLTRKEGVDDDVQEDGSQTRDTLKGCQDASQSGKALAMNLPEEEEDALSHHDDPLQVDILAEQDSPIILHDLVQPLLPTESLSLAAYADHSPTLQKLVDLGIDLSKVERKEGIASRLIKMDFERDMKDKIVFLHRAGLQSQTTLARFLTINPFVLTEELENLETRLNYLASKKFSNEAITQILIRAPYFISFSVDRLDRKLGFFQRQLSLSGDEMRSMITKTPKLVTTKIQGIKDNVFVLRKQLGFTAFEMKELILAEPRLLLRSKEKLIGVFDYVHNHMGVPHKQLMNNPQVFNGRIFKLQERHQFLKKCGRAQYDPKEPKYVAVECLAKLPDDVFCQEIAKTSLEEYTTFLKTL